MEQKEILKMSQETTNKKELIKKVYTKEVLEAFSKRAPMSPTLRAKLRFWGLW